MLPPEVVQTIFVRAAEFDAATARSLALVSKLACRCTQKARWSTLVVTSARSLIALLTALSDYEHVASDVLLSVPGRHPTHYTRSLFVDTGSDTVDLLTVLHELPVAARRNMISEHTFLSHFPRLTHLSLGSAEWQAFSESLSSVSPTWMSLVYDGNETLLQSLFPAYLAASAARGARHVPAAWKLCAPPIRRRLRYLHLIGIDPQNELTGLPPPISVLEPLCAGSCSPGSFLHAYLVLGASESIEEVGASTRDDWVPGLTHLRYDTRRFSFRPTDVLASRMHAFFQELHGGAYLHETGTTAFRQLDLCWQRDVPPSVVRSQRVEAQREARASSLYTGGWPTELRSVWTDRDQALASTHESFRYELYESLCGLYDWKPPEIMPEYVHVTEGAYIQRILHGYSAHERAVLEHAAAFGTATSPPAFRVRYPSQFVRLGEERALLREDERFAHFLHTIQGI